MARLQTPSSSNLKKTADNFMPSPEQITIAISTIDQLSGWLENAGLNQVAIAQFKFNSLAAMYPELKEVAEKLIQSFADDYYLEKYGTNPPKIAGRKVPTSNYPSEAIEIVDRAIETVFNPKKKSES